MGLLSDTELSTHADGTGEDLVKLLLLNGCHVDSSILPYTLRLSLVHITSQSLFERDLVVSLVSGCCDRTSEDIHKVFSLYDV